MWTTDHPTEEGLYAVVEPFSNASGRAIYDVTRHETGVLVYGGYRRVEDALEGTLWHKLPPLPAR